MSSKRVILPVTHEFMGALFVPDLSLYHAVINYFKDEVEDPYNYHYIDRRGRKVKFWSKRGGFINPKTNKIAFEYLLHWEDSTGASKCHMSFKGMFGKGTRTKNGKVNNITSVGTNIEVGTSYMRLDDILEFLDDFLHEIDAKRFSDMIDLKRSRIFQFARHVRYHERHESDLVAMMKVIKKESSMRGDYHLVDDFKGGKHEMYKLDLPSLDACNIDTEYAYNIKSYRIRNFQKRDISDPLLHPKFEIFLNPKETKRRNGEYPSLIEYSQIEKDLDKALIRLLHLADPNGTMEFVSDEYFDAEGRYTFRHDFPEWKWRDLPKPAEVPLPPALEPLRFLSYIAFNKNGFADFKEILEFTDIPERSAYRYLNQFRELGILDTIRDKYKRVFFKSENTWERIKESLITLGIYFDFGYRTVYGHIMYDKKDIRKWKDRDKNLVPVFQHDNSAIRVETQKDADRLQKEFKELGIHRPITMTHVSRSESYRRLKAGYYS